MSEAYDYIRDRLDDVLKGQERLEEKFDRHRDSQVTQRAEIAAIARKLGEHDKVLILGNGQKALTVQIAEANTRLSDLEDDLVAVKRTKNLPVDTSGIRKEQWITWGKIVALVGLVVSQAAQWFISSGVK